MGWKKQAASSKYTTDYSQCVRCHVAKQGSDRKFHWCESCAAAYEQVKDDKQEAHRNRLRRVLNGRRPDQPPLAMVNVRNVVSLVGGANTSMLASSTPDGSSMICLLVIVDADDQSNIFATEHHITSQTPVVAIRSFVRIHMLARVCHEHNIDLDSITRDMETSTVVRLTHDDVVMEDSWHCGHYGMHEGSIIKISFDERVLDAVHGHLDRMPLQSSQISSRNRIHVSRYDRVNDVMLLNPTAMLLHAIEQAPATTTSRLTEHDVEPRRRLDDGRQLADGQPERRGFESAFEVAALEGLQAAPGRRRRAVRPF